MYDLLNGVRVIEVSLLAPDTLGGNLADLGAEVIKIEEPPYGSPVRYMNTQHNRWNRGKKSVVLSLKTDEGRADLLRLAQTADVFIYGLRAGAAERFGVGYDAVRAVKPDIVYCALSGFGQDGPYRDMATHGWAFDAVGGLVSPTVAEDGLPRTRDEHTLVGIEAGGLFGALAVVAALRKVSQTGESQHLDIAELDCALAFRATENDSIVNGLGDHAMSGYVRYQYYPTKDDRHVMLMALEDKFWRNFCDAIGRADLFERGEKIDMPDASAEDRAQVRGELAEVFRTRTRAQWTQLFIEHNVAGAPSYTGAEALEDPHIQARELSYEQEQHDGRTMRLFSTPIKVVGQEFDPTPAPALGAHTDELLGATNVS